MSRTTTIDRSVANGQASPTANVPSTPTEMSETAAKTPNALEAPSEAQAPATRDGRRAVVRTTAICASVGALGHVLLLVGWINRPPGNPDNLLPWQPVVGASLTVVAIVAFGGSYFATLRARIALMSTFVLTFLLLLTYVLTVAEINRGAELQMAQALLDDFRVIVQTIIGFYFGTETVLSITKIIRAPKENAAAVRRADRDLPSGAD